MSIILTSQKDAFLPILKQLHQAGHTLIATHPPFAQTLKEMDIPVRSLAEFNNPNIQAQAHNIAGQILSVVKAPVNSLGPGALEWMRENLKGFLYPRLADVILFTVLLEVAKPDLIMVHNDVEPLLRAASMWGKGKGVPVLHIPHAI